MLGPEEGAGALAAIVDGISVPVLRGFERRDVSRHLNDPTQKNCGFLVRFRTPRWDRNIRIVWQAGQEVEVLAHLRVDIPPAGNSAPALSAVSDYESWLLHFEPRLFWPENEISDRLACLPQLPLISVILPTFNTPAYFLDRCIKSVLGQRYANWQLCVADDGSSDKAVLDYLRDFAAQEPRICLSAGFPQGGISRASNRALKQAQGEFIVLLDHDDELHPHALVEVVRRLNQLDRCDLIYSDEDKIDLYGQRSKPTFKPAFDREIFLTFDYLGHLIALRRSVAMSVGGFRPECDGAQDWDLLIRSIAAIGPGAVHHVAKPLYHWRMHEESTSVNLHSKPYISKAWIRVLADHLERSGETAAIETGTFFGSMRLRRPVPADARVAVFVREEDGEYQLVALVKNLDRQRTSVYSLAGCTARPVRNGTTAAADSPDRPSVLCLDEINAEVFVFINRPLETVNHLFIDELTGQALRQDCGLVTGLSLDASGKAIHTGLVGLPGGDLIDPWVGMDMAAVAYMRQLGVTRTVEAISDEFFAVRREHLVQAGGFSAISSSHMPRLVGRLIQNVRTAGLAVIVTPFAVATFEASVSDPKPEPPRTPCHESVCLNENLPAFEDFTAVC